jgi:hypothetical protein
MSSLIVCWLCVPAFGQHEPLNLNEQDAPASSTPPAPQTTTSGSTDSWQFKVAPYLWFPGIHGTVGAFGHDASLHVSGGDVLSYFNFGLMGAAEARKNRWLIPFDLMWVRLKDEKALPETDRGERSVNAHVTQFFMTPKVGYTVITHGILEVDALAGLRYWHIGQDFNFSPSGIGRSASANWVDGLGGARITMTFSPKAQVIIAGDAGGGGANSDYMVVGLVAYKIKPAWALLAGWRYIDVDYRGSKQFIFDVAQTGPALGVTYTFGVKDH